ncbi:MAG: histidinol dehydrogenase [Gemmataceae bacterium]|nr:histidinol dehydrogenase [Gemmataceae bacterium]MCI0743701.1 histidinol dehydrogenase [Gemmataceae bacterium]
MAAIVMRRIRHTQADAAQQLEELCRQLSLQADVVSPRGRALTEQVFGAALPPSKVVDRICADVRTRGLPALLYFTEQLDKVRLTAQTVRVPAAELDLAHKSADPNFLATLRRVRQNILGFQLGLLHADATLTVAGKHQLRLRYRPLKRVGVCVPGGAAAYPSTLLMTVCPAQAAGVTEIAVVMPPTPNGAYNPDLLATCHELGVNEVYRVGGAQAVAALAYGVEEIPAVDMIVGPGNIFVTLAKKYVFGQVAIDCLAGPSEIVVLADETANPDYVAADLIGQAEHDPASAVLITWHEPLLDQVAAALDRQLPKLARGDLARASLERFGALALARDAAQAAAWTNRLGPEHLHIQAKEPAQLAQRIDNAGAIFLGPHTPVALGDYVAGPSHVLPTGGTARFASGLSANDFLRRSSVLDFSAEGLAALAEDVRILANKEGLTAHAASVDVRLT